MTTKVPKLHLSEAIAREQSRCKGYLALEKRIAAVNANIECKCKTVDRRKLKAIAVGAPFTISTDELIALDNYFSLSGDGLGDRPLFARQSVLEELAKGARIIFLLGAFPRDEEVRNDVNLWDVKAFQEVLSGLYRFREGIPNALQDIPFLNAEGVHNQDPAVCGHILHQNRPNACGIGSPRASVATETMLCKMFTINPFTISSEPLPFKFIWPLDDYREHKRFVSAFEATAEEIAALQGHHWSIKPERRRALVVNGRIYEVVPERSKPWSDYGIIALQRQMDGQIWLVLAGITGPATFACAIACRTRMNIAIPRAGEAPSPVVWALVHATVAEQTQGIGDIRRVESVDLVGKPQHWPKSLQE